MWSRKTPLILRWFDGLDVTLNYTSERPAATTLIGPGADQAALRGMPRKLWDLN
jgi:hypothetical protein